MPVVRASARLLSSLSRASRIAIAVSSSLAGARLFTRLKLISPLVFEECDADGHKSLLHRHALIPDASDVNQTQLVSYL